MTDGLMKFLVGVGDDPRTLEARACQRTAEDLALRLDRAGCQGFQNWREASWKCTGNADEFSSADVVVVGVQGDVTGSSANLIAGPVLIFILSEPIKDFARFEHERQRILEVVRRELPDAIVRSSVASPDFIRTLPADRPVVLSELLWEVRESADVAEPIRRGVNPLK